MAELVYTPRIIYGTPPPLNWPSERLFALWWTDEVLREMMRREVPEPKLDIDFRSHLMSPADNASFLAPTPDALNDRLRMCDSLIRLLEDTCKYPDHNARVEPALFRVRVARKLIVWRHFPIRQLPAEILVIIFRQLIWSVQNAYEANYNRWSLTATCKHFREVAIADQALWNAVWFADAYPWQRSLTSLERAGTSPLMIRLGDNEHSIKSSIEHPRMTVAQLNHLLDALLPKISQIRYLTATFESVELVELFTKRFAAAGPPTLLEKYEVNCPSYPFLSPPESADSPTPISMYPTPKLRWLDLDGVSIDFSKFHPTNLHTLDLRRIPKKAWPTSDKFSEILAASPGLYKLVLNGASPRPSLAQHMKCTVSDVHPVQLPNLRELVLGNVSYALSMFVIWHIQAPRLMALALDRIGSEGPGTMSSLFSLMTGKFPELQLLSLVRLEIPQSDDTTMRAMVRWLESMPRIKLLKVMATKRSVIDVLCQEPTQYWTQGQKDAYVHGLKEMCGDVEVVWPVLLPQLEFLHFFGQEAGDDISVLTTARQAIGMPFKTVYTTEGSLATVASEELQKIKSSVGMLEIMPGIMPSPAEMDIHRDMAGTVDKDTP